METLTQISGRGGSAFTYINSTETAYVFLLVAGTSRTEQFDDFYKVHISKTND